MPAFFVCQKRFLHPGDREERRVEGSPTKIIVENPDGFLRFFKKHDNLSLPEHKRARTRSRGEAQAALAVPVSGELVKKERTRRSL